jgi:hypothetical protein
MDCIRFMILMLVEDKYKISIRLVHVFLIKVGLMLD